MNMDITWHGRTAVVITDGKLSFAVDPDTAESSIRDADKIAFAVSSREDHDIRSTEKKVIDWPGEYEVKGVSFIALETDAFGSPLAYRFHASGINIAFVGQLESYPSDSFIERLGDVHVLLVDVGQKKESALSAKEVYKLVEAVEPTVVVPIGWKDGSGEFSEFLKEMDVPMPEAEKKFSFKKESLNLESMELKVLERA